MSEENLETFQALREIPEDRGEYDSDDDNGTYVNIHDVLDGSSRIEISHAGGEFISTLQEGIEEDVPIPPKYVSLI